MPLFRRCVDSSDEEEAERPVWPLRRLRLELEEEDFELDKNAEQEPPKRLKRARRRVNPFIDTEAGVDGNANGDEEIDDENNYLDGFMLEHNV